MEQIMEDNPSLGALLERIDDLIDKSAALAELEENKRRELEIKLEIIQESFHASAKDIANILTNSSVSPDVTHSVNLSLSILGKTING